MTHGATCGKNDVAEQNRHDTDVNRQACPDAVPHSVPNTCAGRLFHGSPLLSRAARPDGSEPMETVGRFFLCACCRTQVLICSDCDRGQIYCSGTCSQLVRRASVRKAGRRYQSSRRGRFAHARRMCRYRARQEKVTHQGSLPSPANALLAVDSATATSTTLTLPVCTAPIVSASHCHFCDCRCSEFVRTGFLRGRPVQAHARQRGRPRLGSKDDHSP